MRIFFSPGPAILATLLACGSPLLAQQKGQWTPGQYGLDAGGAPSPGFTYQNITINYSADQLNDSGGNRIPDVTGIYSFWMTSNSFYYVPKWKILGGYFAPNVSVSFSNGSVVADLIGTSLSTSGSGSGADDLWVQPFNLGWNLSRVALNVGYAFTAPTGRYIPPPPPGAPPNGSSSNVGSGYWGNNLTAGATVYLTKNQRTAANVFTDWEIHGRKEGSKVTPGQAFTDEWGFGQIIPLDKSAGRVWQIGLIGYDQFQVTADGGTTPAGLPARLTPYYSVHAIGVQTNFTVPARNLSFFFKYEAEYAAKAHPQGRTIAFGGSWTLQLPKPPAANP